MGLVRAGLSLTGTARDAGALLVLPVISFGRPAAGPWGPAHARVPPEADRKIVIFRNPNHGVPLRGRPAPAPEPSELMALDAGHERGVHVLLRA
ncbi:MAG: hypothetical protein ACREOU_05295 [Candidatus Eiseniibacteriota bacterium]